MAPPNLTRTDAQKRASLLEVAEYVVDLDLTDGGGRPGDATFSTTAVVTFSSMCQIPHLSAEVLTGASQSESSSSSTLSRVTENPAISRLVM